MSLTTYNQCLQKLLSLHGIKFGVKNTKKIADLLGNPEKAYNTVHIAGTCGKGSVANKISQCLKLKGYKVGLYMSPHICSFRERIRINDELISENDVIYYTNKIMDLANKHNTSLTFFEICTVMAFHYFAQNAVDWAVIEAGIGGMYDATNIIEQPSCTVITSIGYDHMSILGDTYEKICTAKAGILKFGCPVVLGPSAAAHEILFQRAFELDCEIFEVKPEIRGEVFDDENKRIAAEVVQKVLRLEFLQSQLKEGISQKLPLRMQILSNEEMRNAVMQCRHINPIWISSLQNNSKNLPHVIIIDVAHNEPALERLCREIGYLYYGIPLRACVCLSKERMIDVIQPIINHFHFQNNNRLQGINYIEAEGPRIKTTATVISELNNSKITPELKSYILNGLDEQQGWIKNTEGDRKTKFIEMLSGAVQKSSEEKSVLVICGTFFMMRDTLYCFDLNFGATDPIDMNEPSMVINLPSKTQ